MHVGRRHQEGRERSKKKEKKDVAVNSKAMRRPAAASKEPEVPTEPKEQKKAKEPNASNPSNPTTHRNPRNPRNPRNWRKPPRRKWTKEPRGRLMLGPLTQVPGQMKTRMKGGWRTRRSAVCVQCELGTSWRRLPSRTWSFLLTLMVVSASLLRTLLVWDHLWGSSWSVMPSTYQRRFTMNSGPRIVPIWRRSGCLLPLNLWFTCEKKLNHFPKTWCVCSTHQVDNKQGVTLPWGLSPEVAWGHAKTVAGWVLLGLLILLMLSLTTWHMLGRTIQHTLWS